MADYDVGVLALSSPPPSSVLTAYRPAVSVRNNGIHDALASGTLRIYAAGRLIFTTELYSATIPASETRDALGTDYWTPPAEGKYVIIADLTCPLDQVESNNHLSPTTITVSGATPPPPSPITPHGSQHEDGGADEITIDGLHGRLADAQPALAHKANHQASGSDQIDLTGLTGILSTPQPIADHHKSHEDDGGDQLSVDGLHGELRDNQPAKVHDNAKHDPNYTTVTEMTNHLNDTTAVHEVATNLEHIANKAKASGYCGLGINSLVPAAQLGINPSASRILTSDQAYVYPRVAFPNAKRVSAQVPCNPMVAVLRNTTETLMEVTQPAGTLVANSHIDIEGIFMYRGGLGAFPSLLLYLKDGGGAWTLSGTMACNRALPVWPLYAMNRWRIQIPIVDFISTLRTFPLMEALISDEHSASWADFHLPGFFVYDIENALGIRVRLSEPDIVNAYAELLHCRVTVAGAPVL